MAQEQGPARLVRWNAGAMDNFAVLEEQDGRMVCVAVGMKNPLQHFDVMIQVGSGIVTTTLTAQDLKGIERLALWAVVEKRGGQV